MSYNDIMDGSHIFTTNERPCSSVAQRSRQLNTLERRATNRQCASSSQEYRPVPNSITLLLLYCVTSELRHRIDFVGCL